MKFTFDTKESGEHWIRGDGEWLMPIPAHMTDVVEGLVRTASEAGRRAGIQNVELGFLRELEASVARDDGMGVDLAKWALAVMRRLWPDELKG